MGGAGAGGSDSAIRSTASYQADGIKAAGETGAVPAHVRRAPTSARSGKQAP